MNVKCLSVYMAFISPPQCEQVHSPSHPAFHAACSLLSACEQYAISKLIFECLWDYCKDTSNIWTLTLWWVNVTWWCCNKVLYFDFCWNLVLLSWYWFKSCTNLKWLCLQQSCTSLPVRPTIQFLYDQLRFCILWSQTGWLRWTKAWDMSFLHYIHRCFKNQVCMEI